MSGWLISNKSQTTWKKCFGPIRLLSGNIAGESEEQFRRTGLGQSKKLYTISLLKSVKHNNIKVKAKIGSAMEANIRQTHD
jgi:hypothetical protein